MKFMINSKRLGSLGDLGSLVELTDEEFNVTPFNVYLSRVEWRPSKVKEEKSVSRSSHKGDKQ